MPDQKEQTKAVKEARQGLAWHSITHAISSRKHRLLFEETLVLP